MVVHTAHFAGREAFSWPVGRPTHYQHSRFKPREGGICLPQTRHAKVVDQENDIVRCTTIQFIGYLVNLKRSNPLAGRNKNNTAPRLYSGSCCLVALSSSPLPMTHQPRWKKGANVSRPFGLSPKLWRQAPHSRHLCSISSEHTGGAGITPRVPTISGSTGRRCAATVPPPVPEPGRR